MDYVVRQADSAAENLKNVSRYLDAAKDVGIGPIALPQNVQRDIESVDKKINASSAILEQVTRDNSDDIRQVFRSVSVESLLTIFIVFVS